MKKNKGSLHTPFPSLCLLSLGQRKRRLNRESYESPASGGAKEEHKAVVARKAG